MSPFTLSSLLALLLFSAAAGPVLVSSASCDANDKKALLAIKAHFNNAYHFASWTADSACCNWYGVDCDPSSGRVTGLRVFQDNLTGTLPAEISGLPLLTTLIFHKLPNLVGGVPSSILQLSHLSDLDLSYNSLSGPVPADLSQLTALTVLHLDHNKLAFNLSGVSFPKSAALIDLSHNAIYGGIPAQVNQLTALDTFNVSYNQLCGEIPAGAVTAKFDEYSYDHNKCLCGKPLPPCK